VRHVRYRNCVGCLCAIRRDGHCRYGSDLQDLINGQAGRKHGWKKKKQYSHQIISTRIERFAKWESMGICSVVGGRLSGPQPAFSCLDPKERKKCLPDTVFGTLQRDFYL
jgi:hypothetical protein